MKDDLKREIGQRMRKIRKTLGYTQEKMVSFFKIGRANYSRIEKGEVAPGVSILKTMRLKFNVSLDWLIANTGKISILEQEKTQETTLINFGESSEEIIDMFNHMGKIPMLRHAMLSYYLEYKIQHQKAISTFMETVEQQENSGEIINGNSK